MRSICKSLLGLFRWKTFLYVEVPPKCIISVAPHTSNWDFIIGKLYYTAIGGKPHFLMKKEWFFFPLNYLLKAIGGIPVDRKNKHSLTEQIIEMFNKRKHFQLAIAPEGTRKKNPNWKTGFYYMALGAGVPIVMASIDYKLKEIGIHKIFYPTGNLNEDLIAIKDFYRDFKGKHPENFSI